MLVVASNVPAKNMSELVALAKAQPGKLNFASTGPGSLPHLAGELVQADREDRHRARALSGAAPAINDLLGQQVQMTFLDLPAILPHIKSGALRPIALGSAATRAHRARRADHRRTRHAGAFGENWYGMVAPAATPPAIVAALNRITTTALADPGREGKARRAGPDRGRRHAGTLSRLHRERNSEMGESYQGRRGCNGEIRPIRLPIGLLCDDVSQGDKLRQRFANFLKRHGRICKNLQIGPNFGGRDCKRSPAIAFASLFQMRCQSN